MSEGIGLTSAWPTVGAIGAYAALQSAVARDDADASKFEADVRAQLAAIGAESLFFTLELNQLEDWEIEAAFRARPEAERWRPWLRRVRKMRPHELSPDLERLLLDRAPSLANWSRLFDETLARMSIPVGGESLTLSEALNRLADASAERRRVAAEGLAQALSHEPRALALPHTWRPKAVEDPGSAPDSAAPALSNEVDPEAVAALEAAVVDAYPRLSHRYYALKARAMGRTTLDYWDRNAPLTEAPPRRFTWDEARQRVLESFAELSPKFAATAAAFLDNLVDGPPAAVTNSGAFSHPVTADRHPYLFLN